MKTQRTTSRTTPAKKRVLRRKTIKVPAPSSRSFYGHGIPGVDPQTLAGKLIVVEGSDGSGRSTQIRQLVNWLEGNGHATIQVGLKRSNLVCEELEKAKNGNILSPTTFSLFYATDFADQLENTILPALKAGFMVLADRYIYTLMVRDLVRGMRIEWLRNLYGIALVPDAVFYLKVDPEELMQRIFQKQFTLDYWESGMDLGLSRDMFASFLQYQELCARAFEDLQKTYNFTIVDGTSPPAVIREELRSKIESVL